MCFLSCSCGIAICFNSREFANQKKILLAVEITNNLKDGLAVFHFLRISVLIFSDSYSIQESLLWPIIGFVAFRLGSMAINRWTGLWMVLPSDNHIK